MKTLHSDLSRRSVMSRMAQTCLGVGMLPSMEHLFSGKAFAVGEGAALRNKPPRLVMSSSST
jgi:hypothetical protein